MPHNSESSYTVGNYEIGISNGRVYSKAISDSLENITFLLDRYEYEVTENVPIGTSLTPINGNHPRQK